MCQLLTNLDWSLNYHHHSSRGIIYLINHHILEGTARQQGTRASSPHRTCTFPSNTHPPGQSRPFPCSLPDLVNGQSPLHRAILFSPLHIMKVAFVRQFFKRLNLKLIFIIKNHFLFTYLFYSNSDISDLL